MRFEWQWREAEEQLKRAIEIDPYRASAHVSYASLLITTGRFAEAIDETKKAKDLDPYNPAAVMSLGKAYYRARDFDGAITYLRQVISDNPANWNAEYVLGYAYLKKGMLSEAITLLEKVGTTKKWLAAAPLGYAYARNGERSKAYDILNEMEAQRNIPSQERAIIYIGLGDKDRAFEWLEKAYAERFPPIISLTTEPIFDDLRSDPRFADLAKRINLTP
jgi:Flp pilus assembly protein TadD